MAPADGTMDGLLLAATLLTALGCGLIAGVLFAYSAFVMNGLARQPAAQGVAAMQAINAAAISVPFMSALFGTAAACLALAAWALAAWALAAWPRPVAPYLLAGGAQCLPVSRRGDPADGAVPHAAQRRPGDRPADGRALVGATTIALRGTPDKEGV